MNVRDMFVRLDEPVDMHVGLRYSGPIADPEQTRELEKRIDQARRAVGPLQETPRKPKPGIWSLT